MSEHVHESMRCGSCNALMEEGAVSVSQGLKWRRMKAGDLADMVEDLPGTHAVLRPNHLIAWRCKKCRIVTLRYGQPLEQHPVVQRRYAEEHDVEATGTDEPASRREER